jgi:hypothetical protein
MGGSNVFENNGTLTISDGTVLTTSNFRNPIDNNGTLIINGGIVLGTFGGISNYGGTVTISGGMVEGSYDGYAIWNRNNGGTINISGGTVSGEIQNDYNGMINITGGTVSNHAHAISNESNGIINISGGMLLANYDAIVNNDVGTINISGGMVLGKWGGAIVNNSIRTVNVSGGIVFAHVYSTDVTEVIRGNYIRSNNAVVVAWYEGAGTRVYSIGTSDDIFTDPATATAIWANTEGNSGILVANGTNTGFIPIEIVTVGTTGVEQLKMTDSELYVYPNPTNDKFVIEYDKPVSIKLYDMLGKETFTQTINGKTEINISHLPQGVYSIHIISEVKIIGNSKIVKQ